MVKAKEIKISLMAISDYAFVGENGKLGVIGIFDVLGVPNFPAGHPEMFLVATLKGRENSEHDIQLKLEDSSGQELFSPNPPKMKIRLSNTGSGNIIQRLFNLGFKQAGIHKFVLLVDGKRMGETKLSVIKIGNNGKTPDRESN